MVVRRQTHLLHICFVGHVSEEKKEDKSTTISELREMMEVDILWQGDGIRCMKSFGRADCNLWMKERIEILKLKKNYLKRLINSNNEFYGACSHKTKLPAGTKRSFTDISQPTPSALMKQSMQKSPMTTWITPMEIVRWWERKTR